MRKVRVFESKECGRIQKLMDHFLAGELTVESNQEILLHLEDCSTCRQEEKSRVEARRILSEGWVSQPTPPDLEDKIVKGLEANQGPLHKKIFKDPLVFENGYIVPPTGPGLGIEFDEDVLKAHLIGESTFG